MSPRTARRLEAVEAWVCQSDGRKLSGAALVAVLVLGIGFALLVLPFSLWLMKHTMLGNPLIKPWEDLARLAGSIEMEQFMFGSWYICRAIKS